MTISDYLASIKSLRNRQTFQVVLEWVKKKYPNLKLVMKYNQPMFLDHGSYITGFNALKNHYNIGLEGQEIVKHFIPAADELGLTYGHKTIHVPYDIAMPTDLFQQIIDFKIKQKKNIKTFWLPAEMRYKAK